MRRSALALVALTAFAALIRFWRIGHQSFWLDETFTAYGMGLGFGDMLDWVVRNETTPPLFYVLEWAWSRVFGHGEAALRSLSAVLGTATVPVTYLAARELFDRRAALVAAALVTVNPYFVWYSQEARSYALLVLLTAVTLLAWARALRTGSGRSLVLWAVAAALAVVTHYFAAFIVAPEGAWLVWRLRSRTSIAAAAAVVAAGVAVAPLALHQRTNGADFIGSLALGPRLTSLPKKLVTGELGTPTPAIGAVAALLMAAALVYAVTRRDAAGRAALVLAGLAAAAVAIPLALALIGADYLLPRNVIPAYVPLIVAVAAGLAAVPARALGIAGTAVVAAVGPAVDLEVAYNPHLQRDDWRGASAALGPPTRPRAILVTPADRAPALAHYAGALAALPPRGAAVAEVDAVGNARPPRYRDPAPPPGFRLAERRRTDSWELVRFTADRPVPVTAPALAASTLGDRPARIVVQP